MSPQEELFNACLARKKFDCLGTLAFSQASMWRSTDIGTCAENFFLLETVRRFQSRMIDFEPDVTTSKFLNFEAGQSVGC